MSQTILITGASSGFGALIARQLAKAGHTIWAGLYSHSSDNTAAEKDVQSWRKENGGDLRTVPLDLLSTKSIESAVQHVSQESSQIDTVIHNAGHMTWGFAESFTAEQYMRMYDINVVGAVRLNAAVLPQMRTRQCGHIIWVSSSSVYGGKSPLLGPYFAAKSAMDSLAQSFARELNPWGIETTIFTPGLFASGTNHFQEAMQPGLPQIAREYEKGAVSHVIDQLMKGMSSIVPADADPSLVAKGMAKVVAFPRGQKPYRWFVDPVQDGTEFVTPVVDQSGDEFYRRLGLEDMLKTKIH